MRVAASSNLAAIISACWCRGGTGEVYDPRGELGKLQTFVVKTTPDAQRLAQATERAGATVHASWIGDIALAAPIRVSLFFAVVFIAPLAYAPAQCDQQGMLGEGARKYRLMAVTVYLGRVACSAVSRDVLTYKEGK